MYLLYLEHFVDAFEAPDHAHPSDDRAIGIIDIPARDEFHHEDSHAKDKRP